MRSASRAASLDLKVTKSWVGFQCRLGDGLLGKAVEETMRSKGHQGLNGQQGKEQGSPSEALGKIIP